MSSVKKSGIFWPWPGGSVGWSVVLCGPFTVPIPVLTKSTDADTQSPQTRGRQRFQGVRGQRKPYQSGRK